MSGSAAQTDRLQKSDSDLSLLLSDASSLSSADSDQPEPVKKPNKKKKMSKKKKKATNNKKKKSTSKTAQQQQQYCICRRGYNGKDFMIECEQCKEWFHGACVGLDATATIDRYICKNCEHNTDVSNVEKNPQQHQRAGKTLLTPSYASINKLTPDSQEKPTILLSIPKPQTTIATTTTPMLNKVATTSQQVSQSNISEQEQRTNTTILNDSMDDDDEMDDICVLCEGDCVCGAEQSTESAIPSLLPTSAFSAVSSVLSTSSTSEAPALESATPASLPLTQQQQQEKRPSSNPISQSQTKIIISLPKMHSKKKKKKSKKKLAASSTYPNIGRRSSQASVIERDGFVEKTIPDKKGKDKKSASAATKNSHTTKKNKKKKQNKEEEAMPQKVQHKGKSPTVLTNILHNAMISPLLKLEINNKDMPRSKDGVDSYEEDEEVIVDDLDDLLETMSPLSEHLSNDIVDDENSLSENEEFFTDDSLAEENEEDNVLLLSDTDDGFMAISSVSSTDEIDSGDDEDIENEETLNIINELEEKADQVYSDNDNGNAVYVEDDYEDEEDEEEYYQQYYAHVNSRWTSSDEEDEDEEEEEEYDFTTATVSQNEKPDAKLDTFHNNGSTNSVYNNLTAAFLQALAAAAATSEVGAASGTDTPSLDLTNALAALSTTQRSVYDDDSNSLRRLSLPSSAVSAVRRMRGSRDYTTSESLRALSAVTADDLSFILEPIEEAANEVVSSNNGDNTSNISKLSFTSSSGPNDQQQIIDLNGVHEQLIDILNNNIPTASANNSPLISPTTPTVIDNTTNSLLSSSQYTSISPQPSYSPSIYSQSSSRQLLPKPSGSGSVCDDNTLIHTSSTIVNVLSSQQTQSISETPLNKRKAAFDSNHSTADDSVGMKRSKITRSNSFDLTTPAYSTKITSFSTPASPTMTAAAIATHDQAVKQNSDDDTAVSMDEFLDTSKLYAASDSSRSPSPLPPIEDDPYSRDLSRWQRIPIGAFRLMRFKNKLWLDR
ncbi:hypothetical protein BDF20DRAFT_567282 [Mycotypha africana]|uniref:uncharacterized protein n=1 Tax=Mycotypha africana TaxID=64632 RepID=UPI0022FFD5D7|nr:uncharacterized protein BDF20DRAFT_567282 [Mycotypha africana]KAI8977431.1 hypothetical protein BDF20DRAFT_567282 [Mycotypha africana]